jgi:predicted HicB family RNase H-like nuclease
MRKRRKLTQTTLKRSELLNVRLNPEERRLFAQRAALLGISLSSWARMVLRNEVTNVGASHS